MNQFHHQFVNFAAVSRENYSECNFNRTCLKLEKLKKLYKIPTNHT